jgi:HD-GYP domain-containing protein (c-di-GMP phosphodiesterase class II)
MSSTLESGGRPEAGAARAERGALRLGRDFLFAFRAALRALQFYPLENRTVQNTLRELASLAARLAEQEGAVALRFVGDACFVNDLRLRVDLSTYATFGAVGRALGRHGVGALELDREVGAADWVSLISALLQEPPPESAFDRLLERLAAAGVRHVRVAPAAEAADRQEIDEDSREAARQAYSHSVAVARETMLGARMGKGVSLRRVKRSVQKIVDQVLNNEGSILGMTVLRDYDPYTFAHSVNVCIFSVALGKKIGLSKAELYELGIGALLHDLGKIRMPIEVTTKAGKLDDAEWAMIREHPTEGLLALLEMRGPGELPLRTMLMAYEHHMKVDLSGYPRSIRARRPGLFSRIVAIADGFDAATSRRSYQSEPLLPDRVLQGMRSDPARGFDPVLVKAFISMTGIFPVGSVVVLDTLELAVVVAPSSTPGAYHQPVVRVIFDGLGNAVEPPRTLDLTETDPARGTPRRAIIKTTDPERYGIDVRDHLA